MTDHQRPEGKLLQSAIKRAGLSVRKVAQEVGLSDTRLRHVLNGYQPVGQGQVIQIVGPADTLAKIAAAVDVSPEELRAVGRADAASALEDLRTREGSGGVTLDADRYEIALEALEAWMDADERPLHPPTPALWLWTPTQLATVLADQASAVERALGDFTRAHVRNLTQGKALPRDEEGDRHGQQPEPSPMNEVDDPKADVRALRGVPGFVDFSRPVSEADGSLLDVARTGDPREEQEGRGDT